MQFRSASSKQHSTTPAARYNLSRLELAVCTRGFFFFNDTATTEIYTLSLHDALRSQRVMEIAAMRDDYADPRHHARLMTTLRDRLGHSLAGLAEDAKIAVAQGGTHEIDLFEIERDLCVNITEDQAVNAIAHDLDRIVQTAIETAALAGLKPDAIDALY